MSQHLTSILTDQDRLVATWRQHPIALVRPAAPVAITVTAVLLLALAGHTTTAAFLALLLILPLTLRFVWRAIQWWEDKIIVTEQQVLQVSGLFRRERDVLPLMRVTGLTYHDSIIGRMIGYGECELQAAGQNRPPMRIRYMPDPQRHSSALRLRLTAVPAPRLP
jgi:uncharacterized membrane protein YdbT with pleckstrin-like domain